jgi:mRNA interferase MazF
MKKAGDVVIFEFPQTDFSRRKPRPALLICQMSSLYDDWLLCMISSQLQSFTEGVDELMRASDSDFTQSGLIRESIIRVTRIAVVDGSILSGKIGEIDQLRLKRIKENLAAWITAR